MVNRRIISYCLILLAVLVTGSMVLSVGQTQAHYVNTKVWNTVIEPDGDEVTSNCLVKTTDAPLTVLLGEMPPPEYPVSFTLESISNVSGTLTWSVDKAEYLDVKMSIGGSSLTQSSVTELKTGVSAVTMTLVLTEKALTTVHDAMDVNVTVNWSDSLQGTFRVTLPAVTEEDLPAEEETEPAPTEGEEGSTDVPEEDGDNTVVEEPESYRDSVSGESGESDSGTNTDNNNTQASEYENSSLSEENQEDTVETTQDEEMASSQSDVSVEQTDSEPTTAPATEPATEPTTAPTDPSSEEPSAGDEEQYIRLETISSFAPSAKIPVSVSLTEGITQVRLGMGNVSDAGIEILQFPAFTCYSLDKGASYYMVYHANTIEINPQGSTQVLVLLDFSRVNLSEGADVVLAAEGYVNQSLIGRASASTTPDVEALYQIESRLLTRESSVEISLTKSWKAYTFDYSVEMLSASTAADGQAAAAEYIDVDLSTWSADVFDEENCMLTFLIDETLPPAGTYRVSMNWSYEGICFAQTQTTFFINYSVYSESE